MKKYLNLSNYNERYIFINISSITLKILEEENFKKFHKSIFFNSENNRTSIFDYIKKFNIKTIVIETSELNHLPEKITNELIEAKLQGIEVYEVHEFYERTNGRIPLVKLNSNEYLVDDIFSIGLEKSDFVLKRFVDLAVSLMLLPFAIPVVVFGALLVFFNSPGKVMFYQERVGKNSKKFKIYKLRTMKINHNGDYTKYNDDRLLTVGKFLRTTKIDELPQLFNVLNGNMSLIGPRPEQQKYVEKSISENSYFDLRHLVKPGITGWAQVNLPKATPKDNLKKLEYDLYYIKNYSALLDIKILLRTVKVLLTLNSN